MIIEMKKPNLRVKECSTIVELYNQLYGKRNCIGAAMLVYLEGINIAVPYLKIGKTYRPKIGELFISYNKSP